MIAIQDFINQYNGQSGVGDANSIPGQCVALVNVWEDAIGAPHIIGNACDLPQYADRNAYNIIPNTPEFVPMPGDIGVCPAGWAGSDVGHTFIVAPGTTQQTLVVFEQNDHLEGGDGSCRLFSDIGWPEGLVFIHPYVLDAPPAPQPEPQPAPSEPQPSGDAPASASPADPAPAAAPEQSAPAPADAGTSDSVNGSSLDPQPATPSPQLDPQPVLPENPQPASDNANGSSIAQTPGSSQPHNSLMSQITSRLVSRKLWAAVAGVILSMVNGDVNGAMWVILAYLGVQGAIDHKNAGS